MYYSPVADLGALRAGDGGGGGEGVGQKDN